MCLLILQTSISLLELGRKIRRKEVRKIKTKKFQYPVVNGPVPIKSKSNNNLMTVKNLTDKSADLYIYGEIVDNTDWKWDDSDVMPNDVKEALEKVDGLDTLNIYVNSPGGSIFAGLAIYNMLKRNKAYKKAYIDGLGASMASVIPFAADEVFIPSNAFLMVHKPLTYAYGNAIDFRKLAEDLDVIETGLVDIYKENLQEGVDIETVQKMMEDETWLNGEDAAKYFNVKVIEPKNIVAYTSDILSKYNKTPQILVAQANEKKRNNEPLKLALRENEELKFQNELDLLNL